MALITFAAAAVKPRSIYAYFDKVQIWLRTPADSATIAKWRNECGRGGLYAENGLCGFPGDYHQRVELRQPSDRLLGWIAQIDHALVNRVEVALDHIFECWADRDDALQYLHQHLVRRWHGKKQRIKIGRTSEKPTAGTRRPFEPVDEIDDADTRYDAGRSAPNGIAFYRNDYCRITGELHCLHVEWRAKGVRAVRGIGIQTLADLAAFDHRAFWQERLRLVEVDPERLGRSIRNHHDGGKSRSGDIQTRHWDGLRYNEDLRYGRAVMDSCDSMQELLDKYGAQYRIHRIITSIPNEDWLPGELDQTDQEGETSIEGTEVKEMGITTTETT